MAKVSFIDGQLLDISPLLKMKCYRALLCFEWVVATKVVGILGVITSLFAIAYISKDIYANNGYQTSKHMIHFLGYDWKEMHNLKRTDIIKGKLIWMVALLHFLLYLSVSMILVLATTVGNWWCTTPWLTFVILNITTKTAALITTIAAGLEKINSSFSICSIVYLMFMTWWWIVVLSSAISWIRATKTNHIVEVEMRGGKIFNENCADTGDSTKENRSNSMDSAMDSPVAYDPNICYTRI